ncbi:alpha/beta-hydrolase [Ramicandelaber brevisporus]|nr:alpha/beta-hydrolase [Ramicandelaber brevisporus]
MQTTTSTRLLIPAQGFSLAAKFTEASPNASSGPADVIVLAHGFTDTLNTPTLGFHKHIPGYAAVVFDFRGNGESGALPDDGYRYPSDPTQSLPRAGRTRIGNYEEEAEDVDTVVEYVRTVMKRNVKCVLGYSKGASSVALYAAKKGSDAPPYVIALAGRFILTRLSSGDTKRAKQHGTVSGGPPVSYRTPLTDRYQPRSMDIRQNVDAVFTQFKDDRELFVLTHEDLLERFAVDMDDICAKINTKMVRLLVIHGDADQIIPVEDAQSYRDAIAKNAQASGGHMPQLHIMPGADHSFVKEGNQSHLAQVVAAFCGNKPLPSSIKTSSNL